MSDHTQLIESIRASADEATSALIPILRALMAERDQMREALQAYKAATRDAYELLCDGEELHDEIVYDYDQVDVIRKSLHATLEKHL